MSFGQINAYTAATSIVAWNGNDTAVATGEQSGPFSGANWGSSGPNIGWSPSNSCIVSFLTVVITGNDNTDDGATITVVAPTSGNGIVTIDQATGTFRDITFNDVLLVSGSGATATSTRLGWLYTEATSMQTINAKCVSQLCEMI